MIAEDEQVFVGPGHIRTQRVAKREMRLWPWIVACGVFGALTAWGLIWVTDWIARHLP